MVTVPDTVNEPAIKRNVEKAIKQFLPLFAQWLQKLFV